MTISRRQFLLRSGLVAAGTAVRDAYAAHEMPVAAEPQVSLLDTNSLARYVDELPLPPIMRSAGLRASPVNRAVRIPYYRINMRPFQAPVHRDVPPTSLWGYGGICPGPTLEVRRDQPVQVEWVNQLPARHFLPIDHSLHGAGRDVPEVRTVVHLHGGRTPPESDGYPENWFVPGKSATCYYPNGQDATALFYHDHAMGITRLNTVAGLTGMYLIRDELEDSLPLPRGPYEIPLVLFDRSFNSDGSLYYSTSGNADSPWVSQYYGSAILVNGKIFPNLRVQPRKYRFRVLNSSNGSFYRLSFGTAADVAAAGVEFLQIGSEQGLLQAPVALKELIVGPGERVDLVLNFAPWRGKQVYLRTDAAVFMQFQVGSAKTEDSPELPGMLRPAFRMQESAATRTRQLTIGDSQDRLGQSSVMLLNNTPWHMPVTEDPRLNSTEIWTFINLTDDSHPIHLHLVRFQVLDRRPFDLGVFQLTGKVVYTGPPDALSPGELGWKDTVRVDPQSIARIIVKFEGFAGRYVWHCHMLEHEDNEMMRPYDVLPSG
jgi:spore coat protein A